MTGADEEPILTADNVGKLYARRSHATRQRLRGAVGRALFGFKAPEIGALSPHEFWAVGDVSFELRRGKALGIIGLNGSGKTTLLRILAGQLLPDRGEVRVKGSTAAMIDLTAGFQTAASGRENIFLRAAALGFSRKQTLTLLDEIIGFSELGDAVDAPLSSYSSGMKMRLAFSIMAMVQPDILFIDEVLAVGDFRFKQKCLARIREMRARSAFVFVSHSMKDISNFCDQVIVLHKGKVRFVGLPDEAIEIYEGLSAEEATPDSGSMLAKAMGPQFVNDDAISDVTHYWCDGEGRRVEEAGFSDPLRLCVRFKSNIAFRNLIIGVPIWNMNGQYVTGVSTQITSDAFDVTAGESAEFMLEIAGGMMNPGTLKSVLTVIDGVEFLYRKPNPDIVVRSAPHPTWGAVTIPHTWRRVGARASSSLPVGQENEQSNA